MSVGIVVVVVVAVVAVVVVVVGVVVVIVIVGIVVVVVAAVVYVGAPPLCALSFLVTTRETTHCINRKRCMSSVRQPVRNKWFGDDAAE